MFAGPNGSGKTTVKTNLQRPSEWFGVYLNPDELEAEMRQTGSLSLTQLGVAATTESIRLHLSQSELLRRHDPQLDVSRVVVNGGTVVFRGLESNSYLASVLSDYLRREAVRAGRTLTFETVMSSPDKIDFLREAQSRGYRTYLYYIATEDCDINIQRVRNRVAEGGHGVPEDKIVQRYRRSLNLLGSALPHTTRGYFFDTSEEEPWWFAELTAERELKLTGDEMPNWFQPIWEQF